LTIRKLHVVAGVTLLHKDLGSRTKLQQVGENLCANVASQVGCFVNNTWQNLAKCWTFFHSFDHNSLVSRPFLARKVSNRSSHHVLQNGLGAVSSIQPSIWSTVRSNLGQTWSTLVKPGRIWSKLSKLLEMYPGLHFEGFWARWVLVGLETARSNLGQPWSNLVNPSQTWSNFGKCALDPVLRLFAWRALVGSGRLGSGCLVLRTNTRENPGGKNGVMTLLQLPMVVRCVGHHVRQGPLVFGLLVLHGLVKTGYPSLRGMNSLSSLKTK
jgi:hypothetical protein